MKKFSTKKILSLVLVLALVVGTLGMKKLNVSAAANTYSHLDIKAEGAGLTFTTSAKLDDVDDANNGSTVIVSGTVEEVKSVTVVYSENDKIILQPSSDTTHVEGTVKEFGFVVDSNKVKYIDNWYQPVNREGRKEEWNHPGNSAYRFSANFDHIEIVAVVQDARTHEKYTGTFKYTKANHNYCTGNDDIYGGLDYVLTDGTADGGTTERYTVKFVEPDENHTQIGEGLLKVKGATDAVVVANDVPVNGAKGEIIGWTTLDGAEVIPAGTTVDKPLVFVAKYADPIPSQDFVLHFVNGKEEIGNLKTTATVTGDAISAGTVIEITEDKKLDDTDEKIFVGWTLDPDADKVETVTSAAFGFVDNGNGLALETDKTVYAVWAEKPVEYEYAIHFFVAFDKKEVGEDGTTAGKPVDKSTTLFTKSLKDDKINLTIPSDEIGLSEDVVKDDTQAVEKYVAETLKYTNVPTFKEKEKEIADQFEAKDLDIYALDADEKNPTFRIDWYVVKYLSDGIHVDGKLVKTTEKIEKVNVKFVDENEETTYVVVSGSALGQDQKVPEAKNTAENKTFADWTLDGKVVSTDEIVAMTFGEDTTFVAKYTTVTPTEPTPTENPKVDPEPTQPAGPIVPIIYVTPTPEPTPEVTPEPTPVVTPEPTPEVTPVVTPEPTPEVTPVIDTEEPETPEGTPEDTAVAPADDVVIEEDETPEGTPDIDIDVDITPEGLPQTGLVAAGVLYGIGAALVGVGSVVVIKVRRKEDEE